jgi:NAD(P)-dependent dehydrogenase (short-subunit alcohol dehydrogenase family)
MLDLLDLSEHVIFITGACGGIGQVVVATLAEHGALVLANDVVSPEEAARVLPLGERVEYVEADARDAAAIEALFAQLARAGRLPTIVCCHAGMVDAYPVTDYPLERFDELMSLNLRAAFVVAQSASRSWRAAGQPGQLIFTSSWVQDVPWPEITPYNASKAGLKALMRGFARELAPYGIRANAIAPGIVGVGMARRQWDTDPSYRARAQKAIPLGDLQSPESVAHAFLFLCSPLSSYMTGAVLLVDGGCSLYPMD